MTGIAAVLAFASPPLAAREPVNVAVEFAAPAGCSEREVFASSLKARSNRIQIVEPGPHVWAVNVRLSPKDRGVHGELRLTDEAGESELRAVDGADCAEVVEALSLTAALAIEQIAGTGPSIRPGSVAPATTATASGSANCATTPPGGTSGNGQSATPNQTKFEAAASAGVDNENPQQAPFASQANHIGLHAFLTERVSPQVSVGMALEVGRRFTLAGPLNPELSMAVFYVPGDIMQPETDVQVSYTGVSLQGCPLTWAVNAHVTLSPCVVYEVGTLKVSARHVDVSSPSSRLTSTLGAVGRVQLPLTQHNAIELRLGLLRPLSNRSYVVPGTVGSGTSDIGQSMALGWQLGIGWLVGW